MYIKIKVSYLIVGVVLLGSLMLGGIALAGDPDSSADPSATSSYSLEDLYQRLSAGTVGTSSVFTEPTTAPGMGTMHSINEIMGKAPVPDNTNGATTTQVLAGQTFWGLTASQWATQTGTMPNAGVPKTGQTSSEATGDDGDLQKGVAWPTPRFTDNGDGTVTDNLTGLIWLKNADCFGSRLWATALTDANGLANGACGLSDGSSAGNWRLPNVRELQSLVDYGRYDPALPSGHPFTDVQSGNYWSGSTYANITSYAWHVYPSRGNVVAESKTKTYDVWPVRGGQ